MDLKQITLMRLKTNINPLALLIVIITGAILTAISLTRLDIDTDIVHSLPTNDPVIADGVRMFEKNPVKDQIAIDIGSIGGDRDLLLKAVDMAQADLNESGLFETVGNRSMQEGLGDLAGQAVSRLPMLFSADELQRQVAPRLTADRINKSMIRLRRDLLQMDGIGQAADMAADPLGLRELVLARLAAMNPSPGATIHRGHIFSADGHHLLLLATPKGSGTDSATARSLNQCFEDLQRRLDDAFGKEITLTPTGAFRAALDNETLIRSDVNRAILWATIGIGVLLLAAFARPLTGLMALLPALAGTVLALFVFSLLHRDISVMVLGFGGAIVSITVDHGIAYLLFVEGGSAQASREIRAVGLLAVLTSVGAFGVLAFSGFVIFEELGLFSALGIGFAFLFVHTAMPRIICESTHHQPGSRRLFSRLVDGLASAGLPGLILALVVAVTMIFFIRPHFNTKLNAMNSLSERTEAAERLMTTVWGDIFSSVYLMTEADDLAALQAKSDQLLETIAPLVASKAIQQPVTSSLFYPGPQCGGRNLAAWRAFWNSERIRMVRETVNKEAVAAGFRPDAFKQFFQLVETPPETPAPIPAEARSLLGISQDKTGDDWRQMIRITRGPQFDGETFYRQVAPLATVFDSDLFSKHMGELLFSTFMRMLVIIGISLVVLLAVFFADLRLLLTALLPLAFAFVCTLGTLGMMGRPLDIPALMLSVVILGMGVDYTLLMVRGYQRYRRFDHPAFVRVRTAVVMAAASTLIGFGVLLSADHKMLKSAGLVSFLGIGYCLAGALLILPPLLKRRFEKPVPASGGIAPRYADLEPYPRIFSRFKLRLDPLFAELPAMLPENLAPKRILDIGSGYGVPACWMAEHYPEAFIHGIEPKAEQVRVASLALGARGAVVQGAAPDLPPVKELLDLATMLDMSHYLSHDDLRKTLRRIHTHLHPGGCLVMRTILPRSKAPYWVWYMERLKIKIGGVQDCYRDAKTMEEFIVNSGFEVTVSKTSGKRGDMWWHVARKG